MSTLTVSIDRTLAFPNSLPLIDTVLFTNADPAMATLTLSAMEFDNVHFRSDLQVTGSSGTNVIAITNATTLSLASWTFASWTGLDAVLLTGTAGQNHLTGSVEADKIFGLDRQDSLGGGDGNDSLFGGSGGDSLSGDNGSDFLYGGDGADRMFGGADNDYLNGDSGGDILHGGEGDDTLYDPSGDTLSDALYGGAGEDGLYGGGGTDRLYGGGGNDALYTTGPFGALLDGGDGDDFLFGGQGGDTLRGGAGNDLIFTGSSPVNGARIIGGGGADSVYGGTAADVFVYAKAGDSGLGALHDIIGGFVSGQDRLDLSAIAAAQHFIGAALFGHSAGAVRFDGPTHLLQGDVNGDGVADYEILLDQLTALDASDLIL